MAELSVDPLYPELVIPLYVRIKCDCRSILQTARLPYGEYITETEEFSLCHIEIRQPDEVDGYLRWWCVQR